MSATRPRTRTDRRRGVLITGIAVGAVLLLVAVVAVVIAVLPKPAAAGPAPGATLLVAADTAAAAASDSGSAAAREAAAYLAAQPTAVWLTPEEFGVGEVGPAVTALADEARQQSAILTLVVYGLPERDCGQYSAGGLPPADYPVWTTEIGEALRAASDVHAIVVLEPDSLALAPECGNVDERTAQLRAAIEDLQFRRRLGLPRRRALELAPVDQMADLLRQAGVQDARGFATNVSNYYDSDAEIDYAHRLSDALGGSHAVIDTSRNGRGRTGSGATRRSAWSAMSAALSATTWSM